MTGRTPRLPGAPDLDAACMAAHGRPWWELKRGLTPRYRDAWRDIAFCYLGLVLGVAGVAAAQALGGWLAGLVVMPVGVVVTGFWMSSLVRFVHEGGHHHLHPDRRWNDRLTDWFISAWVLDEVAHNRRVHWQHHLNLGGHGDTENSYFRAPTAGFLIKTVTALYVFEVIGRRILGLEDARGRRVEAPGTRRSPGRIALVLARSALYHLAVLLVAGVLGGGLAAITWAAAMATTYPFFDVLRQILEHRRLDVGPDVDLTQVEHGPNNRLFGKGPLSRWFGNAGFHLHLLHHWDPTVSYTRLEDMERLLLETELRDEIEGARTTYWETWRGLRSAARRTAA